MPVMANFDQFERQFRKALAADPGSPTPAEVAVGVSELPTKQQPKVVKQRSAAEIERFLQRAAEALRGFLGTSAVFTTSEANLDGKDLLETGSGRQVELKSGPDMTDAQPGTASVAWALGDDNDRVGAILRTGMRERRQIFRNHYPKHLEAASAIEISKSETMDRVYEYFISQLQEGDLAGPRLSHFLRCISVGFTKASEIQKSFEGEMEELPLLLAADWDKGLVQYEKAFAPKEPIRIARIERTRLRAAIWARGEVSGRSAEIYPHYKNSYKDKILAIKIPASNWVETACFHVWIN